MILQLFCFIHFINVLGTSSEHEHFSPCSLPPDSKIQKYQNFLSKGLNEAPTMMK